MADLFVSPSIGVNVRMSVPAIETPSIPMSPRNNRMKSLWLTICILLCAGAVFAQDRGTITGTVADPAGAVIANAAIEARNLETGVAYPVVTTSTGNYT